MAIFSNFNLATLIRISFYKYTESKNTETISTAPGNTRNQFSRRKTSRTQIQGIEIHGAESAHPIIKHTLSNESLQKLFSRNLVNKLVISH